MHPVLIAGYVALFVAVGGAFLCVNMLVGWLVRPRMPNAEKLEVYECGEPTIGSSFVQFDLRFYVVALLFIIFEYCFLCHLLHKGLKLNSLLNLLVLMIRFALAPLCN